MNIDSFEETSIKGTVKFDKDGLFFTSIPYDTGWSVKVDGVELEDEQIKALVDSYLCFDLSEGEHTIELSYMPDGLLIGAGVSVFTVIALIAAAIIFKKRRERNVNAPFVYVPPVEPENDENGEPVSIELDLPEEAEAPSDETAEEVVEVTPAEETVEDSPAEEIVETDEEETAEISDTEEIIAEETSEDSKITE